MATQQRATVKKAAARKAPVRKSAAKKAAPKKSADTSIRQSAEKAVNIYLGVIGKGIDSLQETLKFDRKDSEKRIKELEKRGVTFRKELSKRFKKLEKSEVVKDTRAQFNKVQDQVEDAVDSVKDKLKAA